MIEKNIRRGVVTKSFTLPENGFSDVNKTSIDESLIPPDGITFYIMRLAKVIVVHPQGDFFIGRTVQEDSWHPEVSLAGQDVFATGVSRRHAMISPQKYGYEIIDLHSTNGTRLNDHRLVPHKAYPLASGAQLSIGREQLMVIYRSEISFYE